MLKIKANNTNKIKSYVFQLIPFYKEKFMLVSLMMVLTAKILVVLPNHGRLHFEI